MVGTFYDNLSHKITYVNDMVYDKYHENGKIKRTFPWLVSYYLF